MVDMKNEKVVYLSNLLNLTMSVGNGLTIIYTLTYFHIEQIKR